MSIEALLSVQLDYLPVFNCALQQNGFPIVRTLTIENRTGYALGRVACTFRSEPEFIQPHEVVIEGFEKDEVRVLQDVNLKLDYGLLATLTEEVRGTLKLVIEGETREGPGAGLAVKLSEQDFEITAYAFDQWLGLHVMPELLAAFVTPNMPCVVKLQTHVSDLLKEATGSAAIEGYQADRKRVYEICSAIYRAIHAWGIHYSNPASTFGAPGQRIRFADVIYQTRLGTCLDTVLLFASVMEACGLHPVILLQAGHAYVGCHLVDRYFPDVPMDDLQTIRKAVDLDEFVVFETTCVTEYVLFAEAEARARANHLNKEKEFECAIDVIRARYSRIRPLPLKCGEHGLELDEARPEVEALEAGHQRHLQESVDMAALERQQQQQQTEGGRVARWSQKLLDLSLRNRLLNVRDGKLVLPIVCPDIAALEDHLAADVSVTIKPVSDLLSEKDVRDLAMLRNCEVAPVIQVLLRRELEQNRLWALKEPAEMKKRLTALYRQSKSDIEESGVNTLFLAVGFLDWKVSEREERTYSAPILLMPIRLQRKSLSEGIRMARLDEDTLINATLIEFLRSQFHLTVPGVDPLPMDDSGVNVSRVMQIFRQTIQNMKGWEVRETVQLGHFSFGKYIMWNDLTVRVEALKQNPLVNHLIEGGGLYDDGIPVFDAKDVEHQIHLEELYCPMSADASQLAAVLYSQMGKSFVLHGPPGTGKSQTITNIIAHNLALGRRILFVSEKKAALDVVHKRLSAIGLRPFCLELHSNKAGKTGVLGQFSEALAVPETSPSGEWAMTVHLLEQHRQVLDGYVRVLHNRYPNGFSAYDCFSQALCRDATLPKQLININTLTQTREDYEASVQLVSDLALAWTTTTPEACAALRWISVTDWNPLVEKEIVAAMEALRATLAPLREAFWAQTQRWELGEPDSLVSCYRVGLLADDLKRCEPLPAAFIQSTDFEADCEFLLRYAEVSATVRNYEEKLSGYHCEQFAEYDFEGLEKRIQRDQETFILTRLMRGRALVKELSGLKKLGSGKLTLKELMGILPDAKALEKAQKTQRSMEARARELLDFLWHDGVVDATELNNRIESARHLRELVDAICEEHAAWRTSLETHLVELLQKGSTQLSRGGEARACINGLLAAWNAYEEAIECIIPFIETIREKATTFEALETQLTQALAHREAMRSVMRYQGFYRNVPTYGLVAFVEAMETGQLDVTQIGTIYRALYLEEMLEQVLTAAPTLCQFTGLNQEQRVRNFCELDEKYKTLSKQIVFAKLAAKLPRRRLGPCPEGTELGILKRECEKRARQKPVRQLLEQIPTLAPLLKPCFLMSPLSVAQYLPPDTAQFDCIVFDEASQIPVWDAIGVIARGKQLIVVGDPKQMPPTNFFQKGENEEEEDVTDDVGDMESILDECIAAGVHPTYLNWHYRSRHESLISFSNHYYYEDRLCTFPAARQTPRLGIRFEYVPNGVYDRKASRTNRKEAEALVRYLFERLEDTRYKRRSVGVVTFSQAQKDLIEDLVETERGRHPQLESYFSDQNDEPLFVKNLENVQGDERDVICFSIGYAADADGRFSMNFGPLNRQGGERRLNVAITRAKEQVVVFSSIHATQIDLGRTAAVGASHLKYFLDYAEKGFRIQPQQTSGTQSEGLAETIEAFLAANGIPCERAVGCSGYRIDLAVRVPEFPEEYLLGIECDGPVYAMQRTVRDRESTRSGVLKGLGWHLYRAWSVDWALDRKQAEQNLLAEIARIREAKTRERQMAMETAANPALEALKASEQPASLALSEGSTPPTEEPTPATTTPATEAVAYVSEHCRPYTLWSIKKVPEQSAFYDPSMQPVIGEQIREIIRVEGPIYESVLKKRILRAWGFQRGGDNLQRILETCWPRDLQETRVGEETVYWPAEIAPTTYLNYRVGKTDETKRGIDEIPPEEIANVMYEILVDFASCEPEALYRETMKVFGFSVVTSKARRYLDLALTTLRATGRI